MLPVATVNETSRTACRPPNARETAVLDFLVRGLTNVRDLDLEVQGLAGERMVGIDGHLITADRRDGHHLGARLGLGLKAHPGLDVVDAFEHAAWDVLLQPVVALAVGLFRWDADIHIVAGLAALEGFFESGDDVACAMQILQWLALRRSVDDLALGVAQGVIDGNHRVVCNLHENL
jgi:hypothetical protein